MIENNISQYDETNPVRSKMDISPETYSRNPRIIYRNHTFFSVLAAGMCAIGVGFIISCTVTIIYGMNSLAGEPDWMAELFGRIDILQNSLPPMFTDILSDRREPSYNEQIAVIAETAPTEKNENGKRTVITVANKGGEVVSFLSLRIVLFNSAGQVLAESNEFAATPFANGGRRPGPLTPGSIRHINLTHIGAADISKMTYLRIETEITDIRIWDGTKQTWPAESEACSQTQ